MANGVTWTDFDRHDYEVRAGWSFNRVARNMDRLIARCRGYEKNDNNTRQAMLYVKHMKATSRVSVQHSMFLHTCVQAIHQFRHGAQLVSGLRSSWSQPSG